MLTASLFRWGALGRGQPGAEPRLFFAKVVDLAADCDKALRETRYLVIAHTPAQASRLIAGARMTHCSIEFEGHKVTIADASQLFDLSYGVARRVWPEYEDAPQAADDYLFTDEPRNEDDLKVLGLMRGGEQHIATLMDLLSRSA